MKTIINTGNTICLAAALGLSTALAVPVASADTGLSSDNSGNVERRAATALDYSRQSQRSSAIDSAIDNSQSSSASTRLNLTRDYLMNQQYRNADQRLNEQRGYASAVGQGAANQGSASGHGMSQHQGGVSVGSLVNESTSDSHNSAAAGGGRHWQYAPQSNHLSIGGDSYAPISLSNINANGGSIHIGDVNKGNMHNSQIGNNQSGLQGGDSVNSQSNSQQQKANSQTGSQDRVSN